MSYIDAQRRGLLAAAAAVPKDRWMEAPAPGKWSVSEVLEHLRKGEEGVVRLVFKLGKEARRSGTAREETDTSSMLRSLDHMLGGRGVMDRTERREAPDMVRPAGPVEPQTVIDGLTRTREDLHKAAALVDGLALEDLRWTHAALGELNLYQYMLFIGQHEARHTHQIAEIAEAFGARSFT
jgi:uncharacterized damage-inducible protein DinB